MREFRYRLTFSKIGPISFLSHLDLIRAFGRAIQRQKLDISFSNGFNPHPKLSIALPLSIGMDSLEEYIEIEFNSKQDMNTLPEEIQNYLPEGICMLSCENIDESEKIAAKIYAADYIVEFLESHENTSKTDIENAIAKLLELNEILINKKSKSGMIIVNIKQDILKIHSVSNLEISNRYANYCDISSQNIKLYMSLSAGSDSSLNPKTVAEKLSEISGFMFGNSILAKITRTKLLVNR